MNKETHKASFSRISHSQKLFESNAAAASAQLIDVAARLSALATRLCQTEIGDQDPNNELIDVLKYFVFSIKQRRLCERFFNNDLFADPAWDILLDLTVTRLEQKDVAVSSLCIAACVPTTTALRWIKVLMDAGLLERRVDPDDGRRNYIQLTDCTFEKMMAFGRDAIRNISISDRQIFAHI